MSRQFCAVRLKCLFSLVLLLVIGMPALGQSSSSAAVTGIVQDTTDARIPNASVKLINSDTGTESTSTTSKDGIFTIPSVLPGHYRLQIERDGFDTTQLTGITLNVGDNKAVIIRMKVGSSRQTVTVDASGLTINTTDGSVSTVIDRNFVANIPLNGRSFQDLISLTPGVVTQSPQSQSGANSGDFSVNGQRTESNYYILDGVSANTNAGYGAGSPGTATTGSLGASTALGTTQSLLSVDALQEFRVESSTYSAEYGRSPGGQFSFVSRSGTNSMHGSLFNYLRNNFFDANDWFNDHDDVAQPALRQNDFGGTVGGPIWIPRLYEGKDKTFFFISYEGLRLTQPTEASLQYVPSNALRNSAPIALQPILDAFPTPTGSEIQIACNNTTYPCPPGQPVGTVVPSGLAPNILAYSLPSKIDSTSIRLDHQFTPTLHAFLRGGYTPSSTDGRNLSELNSTISSLQTYTAGIDAQVSPTLNDQLRIGYSRAISKQDDTLDSFGGATPTNFAQAMGAGAYLNANPEVYLEFAGIGFSFLETANTANYIHQLNLTDALSWTAGRHTIKAGVDYRRITSPYAPSDPEVAPVFNGPASVLDNSTEFTLVYRQRAAKPLYNQIALFCQDEWRATPTLNLSLGLRWEVEPPPQSLNANKPFPFLGDPSNPSTYGLGVQGASLYDTTWGNFAPRFGVAWSAHKTPGMETVVRSGIGIFYDTGASATGGAFTSVGSAVESVLSNAPVPLTPAQLNLSYSVTPPYSINAFVPNFQLPYTIEWNVAVDQALGQRQHLTLSYLGSSGRRLVENRLIEPGSLNQDYSELELYENAGTSNYQALQVQIQRQVSHGLQGIASYTWSHSFDYGSSDGGYAYIRGNSDFDVRNNFNAALSWDLPLSKGNSVVKALLTRWALDGRIMARTAFPVNLTGTAFFNPVTGALAFSGVNIVSGIPVYNYSQSLPGGREINSAAFLPAPPMTQGNAPRNFLRGFGDTQLNIAVRREFPLFENARLQFRAESFNVLNHPNFGYVDPELTDATFGQATNTLAQSLGTVSPLYQQGGARSMQFALKLLF